MTAHTWVDVDDRAARRIQELLDPSVSHSWLWSVDLNKGSRMSEEDFVMATGSRLGASIAPAEATCRQHVGRC